MAHVRRYTPIVAAVLVVVWMLAVRWDWSFIDDVGLKTILNEAWAKHGVGGLWSEVGARADTDTTWGLFRPLYYVYASVFYLLNPTVAHGVRLAMFFAVVLIPALRLARYPLAAVLAAAVLAANATLYLNLSYLSLQELSGMFLIALGLLTDGPIRRSLLWLGAAWFKTPFVWLFLAWSVYLLFQRKRWAWINVAVGVGTVVAAAAVSRRGDYTQGLGLANVSHAIKTAIPLFGWPGVVGLAAVVAIRPKLATLAWRDPMAWVFLAGGALYLGNLLPWGQAGSYYGAPAIWLLSVGVLYLLLPAERVDFAWGRQLTAGAAVAALIASGYIAQKMTREQLDRNAAVVGVTKWARTVPESDTIAMNTSEGALRLQELLLLHGVQHIVTFIPDGDTGTTPKYYVYFHDQSNGNPRLEQNVVKPFALATVYQPG